MLLSQRVVGIKSSAWCMMDAWLKVVLSHRKRNHWWELLRYQGFRIQLSCWRPLVKIPSSEAAKDELHQEELPLKVVESKAGDCGWGHRCCLWVRKASFRKALTLAQVTQVIKVIHFPVSKASKQHIESAWAGERHTSWLSLQQLQCYEEPLRVLNCTCVVLEMWMLCIHVSTHPWHRAGPSCT